MDNPSIFSVPNYISLIKIIGVFLFTGLIGYFAVNYPLSIGIFIALIFFILVLIKGPYFGICVIVFFIPIEMIFPHGLFDIDVMNFVQQIFHKTLIYEVFLIWLIFFLMGKIKFSRSSNRFYIIFFFFFLSEILSLIFVTHANIVNIRETHLSAYNHIRGQIDGILLFLLITTICNTKEMLKRIIQLLYISAVIVIIIGFIELLLGKNLMSTQMGFTHLSTLIGIRITSTFYDANNLAKFLVVMMLLIIPQYSCRESPIQKRMIQIILPSALVILFFTFSRGGWLILMVGLAILVFRYKYWLQARLIPWFAFFAIFLITVLFLSYNIDRLEDYFNSESYYVSRSSRLDLDWAAYEMSKASPVFGIGFGNFPLNYMKYRPEVSWWEGIQDSHNILMLKASEEGLVGLVILLLFLYYPAKMFLLKIDSSDEFIKRLKVSMGAIFLVFVVHSIIYVRFLDLLMFWTFLGIGYATHTIEEDS